MKILSIDPGIGHSGVVLLSIYNDITSWVSPIGFFPEVLLHFTTKNLYELQVATEELVYERLLIEEPPDKGSREQLKFCLSLKFFMEPVWIQPSQWKPFALAQKWKFEDANTVHESDAFLMLKWYLFTKQGIKI